MRHSARAVGRAAGDLVLASMSAAFRYTGALRVLAYHDVRSPEGLRRQMAHVARHYTLVGVDEVLGALSGGPALPRRAVWVTFDDGDPSVVDQGLPVLADAGVRATMFVCPSVIGTRRPLWFQAVRVALGDGADAELAILKRLPAVERARRLDRWLRNAPDTRQCSTTDLQRFIDAGGSIANHTWDHPLLDQVDGVEVERQIVDAHAWLASELRSCPPVFAYPNGNMTPAAGPVLRRLGYRVALAFDHRVASLERPMQMSRIRVDTTDGRARFAASVSGAHPAWSAVRSGRRPVRSTTAQYREGPPTAVP